VHFVGLGAVNWLSTVHGVNSIKFAVRIRRQNPTEGVCCQHWVSIGIVTGGSKIARIVCCDIIPSFT
jgi:hypothetical protein